MVSPRLKRLHSPDWRIQEYAKIVRLIERFGMRRVIHAIAMCESQDARNRGRRAGRMARTMLLVIAESN